MAARSFGSDNHAGVHPEVLAAIERAAAGQVPSYGDDPFTRSAEARFREVFGEETEAFFVFNGSAANVLALQALVRPYEAVVCAASAHVNVDECGAPERFLGSKLLVAETRDGKLRPGDLDRLVVGLGDQHRVQPRAVSVAQATELGTVYSAEELRALAGRAHELGLRFHVDGARIANAAASLGLGLREATRELGVDVLSFGGTKNGALGAEAVVLFDPALAEGFRFVRKQAMQLASKMRFVAVQLEALLADGLWRRNAEHANAMARLLADAVGDLPGVAVTQPVESNAVFATVPRAPIAPLQEAFPFYVWDAGRDEVRWMTSFQTTADDVDDFATALRGLVS